jgi:dihydrofolate reductase
MDWIRFNDELFEWVGTYTEEAGTAIYGRKTWEMMDAYWPTAGDGPNASKHDRDHSAWYNRVEKIVISRTLHGQAREKTKFIGHDIAAEVSVLKGEGEGRILMFGSASVAQALLRHSLVDEFWLFINPVILGKGIALFDGSQEHALLALRNVKEFQDIGVTGLNYLVKTA